MLNITELPGCLVFGMAYTQPGHGFGQSYLLVFVPSQPMTSKQKTGRPICNDVGFVAPNVTGALERSSTIQQISRESY